MTSLDDLLNQHDPGEDDPDCALLISNPQGLSIIQATHDAPTRQLTIEPRRFWHEGQHDLAAILNKYRQAGYRVDLVSNEDDNQVYTIIAAAQILSPQTLLSAFLQWLRQTGGI